MHRHITQTGKKAVVAECRRCECKFLALPTIPARLTNRPRAACERAPIHCVASTETEQRMSATQLSLASRPGHDEYGLELGPDGVEADAVFTGDICSSDLPSASPSAM
jgi:hypothetical protein